MIELAQVSKTYHDRLAVDGVSLTIDRGEFCALVGPSGCGKSTTLKMINRIVPMTGGVIRIDGQDVTALPVEALRRRIGYVIQSIGLFPHWTVADNIATVPRLLGWPERRVRDRVVELLDLVRLAPELYSARYPDQLSGGQRQRVGVARALAADPDVLLMDEPFGAIDPIIRSELHAELKRIHAATGATIIMVTQDMEEALRLADRIAVMRDGKLLQSGSPADILERPACDFIREFMGRAQAGLALLSVRRIADALKPSDFLEGTPISIGANLRDALSEMLIRHTDILPVSGADGQFVGTVSLADIVG